MVYRESRKRPASGERACSPSARQFFCSFFSSRPLLAYRGNGVRYDSTYRAGRHSLTGIIAGFAGYLVFG